MTQSLSHRRGSGISYAVAAIGLFSWGKSVATPIVRIATVVSFLAAGLFQPVTAQAKDFAVTGTVDCGVPSEARCPADDAIHLWTEDISGSMERVWVDISWFKDHFREEGLEQDDTLCLEVDDAGGSLKAIGVILTCDLPGTASQGRSTGSNVAMEQPKKADDDDVNAGSLLAQLESLPCFTTARGFECPIPESLLRAANDAGLRFHFDTPEGCALVLRPDGVFFACDTR